MGLISKAVIAVGAAITGAVIASKISSNNNSNPPAPEHTSNSERTTSNESTHTVNTSEPLLCPCCSAPLHIIPGAVTAKCEYCQTETTIPGEYRMSKTTFFNRSSSGTADTSDLGSMKRLLVSVLLMMVMGFSFASHGDSREQEKINIETDLANTRALIQEYINDEQYDAALIEAQTLIYPKDKDSDRYKYWEKERKSIIKEIEKAKKQKEKEENPGFFDRLFGSDETEQTSEN